MCFWLAKRRERRGRESNKIRNLLAYQNGQTILQVAKYRLRGGSWHSPDNGHKHVQCASGDLCWALRLVLEIACSGCDSDCRQDVRFDLAACTKSKKHALIMLVASPVTLESSVRPASLATLFPLVCDLALLLETGLELVVMAVTDLYGGISSRRHGWCRTTDQSRLTRWW